ncbi:MAG: hypothetical protein CR993_03415 [Rhodobacterales bacterium]|nr:MAG: hypothetical protein CR993_03415 [Rhodobacterales bacterium]
MKIRTAFAIVAITALSACDGGFSLNPLNWFSGASTSGEETVALVPADGYPEDQDRRIAVARITGLKLERTTAGAIVRATGLPPRLGYWDAQLVPENGGKPENGVLTLTFRIAEPRWNQGTGTPKSKVVNAGYFLPTRELKNIRSVRVIGANNSMTARR